MALLGSRLQAQLAADILSQLQSAFPVPSALLAAEKTAYATAQTNLANAMAAAIGPDVVNEITGHAVTATPNAQSGSSNLPGTVS